MPLGLDLLAQCSFRFNTYLGMAVVLSTLGEVGVTEFGVIISLVIPFINILAVSTLIWYSSESYSAAKKSQNIGQGTPGQPSIPGLPGRTALCRL